MTLPEVMLAYGVKVLAGCIYGYVFLRYYQGDDTWLLHNYSTKEKQLLLQNPYEFFFEITPLPAIRNGSGFFEIARFYLMDLEYCLQAKTLGIINLITQDNYYINVVFWNFFVFWGHYWIFALLVKHFPAKRVRFLLLIFLFPPVAFWLSGLRSDGLLLISVALVFFSFHKWITTRRVSALFISAFAFLAVIIFRTPVAAALLPALISWRLVARFRTHTVLVFLCVYLLTTVLFFTSKRLLNYDLPVTMVTRQQEFMSLRGTAFHLDTLQPSIKSFATVFPQAVSNTFLRPHPWEAKGVLQKLASLDIIVFWMIFIWSILKVDPTWKKIISEPLILVLLFVGGSLYLFTGYVVPFPGAIVRYKVIGELALICVFASIAKVQFEKLK